MTTKVLKKKPLGIRLHSFPTLIPGPKNLLKTYLEFHHHHKHQGLDPLIRSVSRVTTALSNVPSVFQLFSFHVVCSGMISKGLKAGTGPTGYYRCR